MNTTVILVLNVLVGAVIVLIYANIKWRHRYNQLNDQWFKLMREMMDNMNEACSECHEGSQHSVCKMVEGCDLNGHHHE